ncbi:MAG TPA: AraC family transcriptional regulator [Acidobacteriaceae bacterium]
MTRRSEVSADRCCREARALGEKSTLLRWADLSGAELLHADFHCHAFLPHWHNSYMLATSIRGQERVRHEGEEHLVAPGSVLSFNPGELHDGEAANPRDGWHYRALYFSEQLVTEALGKQLCPHPPAFKEAVQQNPRLGEILLHLHSGLKQAGTRLERESLLAEHLPPLFGQTTPRRESPARRAMANVRELIDTEWRSPLSLDDLARLSGLSRFHLLRSFRKSFGLPPHAYQTQLRIHHAKEMLFGGMPAREVALETGFYDQAHLTNTLRRYTGATPGRLHLTAQ